MKPRFTPPDRNQTEVEKALVKIGATVVDLREVGDGCGDLLVGFRGCNFLLEVKTEKGKLNKRQKEFHSEWRGSIRTVRTPLEAIKVVTSG